MSTVIRRSCAAAFCAALFLAGCGGAEPDSAADQEEIASSSSALDGCGALCTQCVLATRTDILPFYQSNGWSTACGNHDSIVANWCGIDPSSCASVKNGTCASYCSTSCGSTCTQCVLNNRTDILPFYQSNGWDTSCGNRDAIVANWCGIDPSGCASMKGGTCASACGGRTTCDNGVQIGASACNPSYPGNYYVCVNPNDSANQWQTNTCPSGQTCQGTSCKATAGGGGGGTVGGGGGGRTTCDNGVQVGGSACNPSYPNNYYVCVNPNDSANQWQTNTCPSGQTCQGTSCKPVAGGGGGGGGTAGGGGGGRTTCDNGVQVGGSACNPSYPNNYYVCVNPNDSANQWQTNTCPSGQTCQGTSCKAGTGGGGGGAAGGGGGGSTGGSFVTRKAREFYANGQRLRFVGMNLRGLAHYGTRLQYASTSQIPVELDEVQRMGAKVIRVYAAGNDSDFGTVASRLQAVLDAAQARGLYVIVVLTDFYTTGFSPRGDDGFYQQSGKFVILDNAFFSGGYRTNYLPWVRTVVARYANHPAIFAWELGNEIKNDPDHAAFYSFAADVVKNIRSLDKNHLISSGMLTGAWMTSAEEQQLYSLSIDVITYHNYWGTSDETTDPKRANSAADYAVSLAVRKPVIVEEAGFSKAYSNRPAAVENDIRYHIDGNGARGYMQWGFTVIHPDNGDGDKEFGMDHMTFGYDYDGMFNEYSQTASRIR